MANTCDCMISGFVDLHELIPVNSAIARFGQGGFELISDGSLAGGAKKLSLAAYESFN